MVKWIRPSPFAAGFLTVGAVAVAAAACTRASENGDWPQLLGPNRDGKSTAQITRGWGDEGPEILWRQQVGEGFAAPSVANGKLVLFHRVEDEEVVEALDPATGRSLWRQAYSTDYRDDFGFDEGPRAAPTIVDGVVFTCGAQAVVQALDLETGTRRWMLDARERFRPPKGPFGAGCSPLVADGRVMLNIGAPDGAGIVALDAATGALLWSATEHGASYAAPVMARIGGLTRALFFTRFGLVDVDPEDGTVRAQIQWRSRSLTSANAASPVVIGERVFISATYGTGAVLLDVTDAGFVPVWQSEESLSNHYATSIHHEGTLYGYHGRQPLVPSLRAIDALTGEVRWSEESYGAGSLLLAGDTLIIMREGGELVLADVSPARYAPRASARILTGTTRAYPALADGVLYVRNRRRLIAVDLRP